MSGDTIVVEGVGLLRDDTPVKIKKFITDNKR